MITVIKTEVHTDQTHVKIKLHNKGYTIEINDAVYKHNNTFGKKCTLFLCTNHESRNTRAKLKFVCC